MPSLRIAVYIITLVNTEMSDEVRKKGKSLL